MTAVADWHSLAAEVDCEGRLYIDGGYRDAVGSETFDSINPADGSVVAAVARGRAADVDAAVAAASAAFAAGSWSRTHPRQRAQTLYRFADLIELNAAELALLDVLEMGKPIADTTSYDIPQVAESLRFFAELADKVGGKTTMSDADVLHYTMREPLGVVGCISPWNYPLLMAAWKFAPALAAGNTVVLKPAEQASLSCLRTAALFTEAGGPPGVFNVVSGYGPEAGAPLALHHGVAKISFTGSTEVGRLMLEYAGRSNLKRVALECGGKSPQIIFADVADLDRAVAAAVEGIYGNMGEVCNAGSRLLVERSIADEFATRFQAATQSSYVPGDPLDPTTSMGPLVDAAAQARVQAHIDHAATEGAALLFGGQPHQGPGAYVAPTAFANVDARSQLAQVEVFGPVAALMTFDAEAEALALANDTIYGLAAGVWTADVSRAHRMVRDLAVGTIWVNTFNDGDFGQPFGGYKQSGNAKDNSAETLLAYTQTKSAWYRI
jgi:gamma-glutamyl-gamma-aminobutyraldehyde dehydrogenase